MSLSSLVRRVHAALPFRGRPASSVVHDPIASATTAAKIWCGYGRGHDVCTICGERILPDQSQYEIGDATGESAFQLHLMCYRRWKAAVRSRVTAARQPAGDVLDTGVAAEL